jgi:iron complex outermembrane receptor protein
VNWKPIADLRLRGGWGQGFRAPTIGELFGTPSRFDQEVNDPCSASQNPTGQVLANCTAHGVPAGYQQLNAQISVLTGGNEDLKAETSKGWNLGAVFSPSGIPGFSVEADYYNIKVKGAIAAVAAKTTLQRCEVNNDPVACAKIIRSSSGQITQINGLLENIGGIDTDGLDFNISYRTRPASWGTIGFTLNNTFLFNYDVSEPTANGNSTTGLGGKERGSPDQAFPKHKAIGIVDWNGHMFGATLTGRYISGVTEFPDGFDQPGLKLNSRLYVDAQARFTPSWLNDGLGFAIGVNNLFDKDPPGCVSCGLNNMDPTTYDVPGRYYYARVSVKLP